MVKVLLRTLNTELEMSIRTIKKDCRKGWNGNNNEKSPIDSDSGRNTEK
jgi:hypothetical protein